MKLAPNCGIANTADASTAIESATWRSQNGRPDPLMFTVDHVNRKYSARLVVGSCLECNHERGHIPAHEYIMIHADRLNSRARLPLAVPSR